MKTSPMSHQTATLEDLRRNPQSWAIGSEQGTGKTWCLMADAEEKFLAGSIQAMVIIAPKGVHLNWVRREIPTHLSVEHRCLAWESAPTKRFEKKMSDFLVNIPDQLAILSVNYEAAHSQRGMKFLLEVMRRYKTLLILDESQKIKNHKGATHKAVVLLGRKAVSRRIASGTLIEDKPADLWAQFEFLHPDKGILGAGSFRSFVATYCHLLPRDHAVVIAAMKRIKSPVVPQIVEKDAQGVPRYKNLDRLQTRLSQIRTRWTKAQCLDLPQKIYQTVYFELTKVQRQIYTALKEDERFEFEPGQVQTFNGMTVLQKLQQVTSGFILDKKGESHTLEQKDNPRVDALLEALDTVELPCVVWAKFRAELELLSELLRGKGFRVVEYHGATADKDRESAITQFQSGEADIFLANASVGGTGLTLTAGRSVIYYSQDYSLGKRLQSEDRTHRIGTTKPVVYVDIVALNTIDENITADLQNKKAAARYIDND